MLTIYLLASAIGGIIGGGLATRTQWRDGLGRNRSASLDAPNWLWSSIVELVARHQAAYLEHCRRYAIDPELAA